MSITSDDKTTIKEGGPALNAELTRQFAGQDDKLASLRRALIVTEREARDSFRDWRIIIPIFLLTLIFPVLANVASALFTGLLEGSSDFENTPDVLNAFLPLLPMLVGFFPTSIALVIALESFVGEKERMSLEPLLSTPLSNTELYIGKVLASIIPPLAAGYFGIVIFVGGQVLGAQQWRPSPELILQIVVLTAVQAAVMVTASVVISSQTTSTRAANLLASVIIVPMSMLVIVESIIMIQPQYRYILWWICAGLVVVVVLMIRTGTSIFNREELLGRSIDHLNLAWAGRVFWDQFTGGVQGFRPWLWYQRSVWPALLNLRRAMLVWLACFMLALLGGVLLYDRYPLPLAAASPDRETLTENYQSMLATVGEDRADYVGFVIIQNLRVLFLAALMSFFTFGVVGLILTTLPFGILSYSAAAFINGDLSLLIFAAALFPHGLVEIPAIMIAGAAALQLGAVVTVPPKEITVGEVWLRQIADTVKLTLAVILPMLVVAAFLEVYITPLVIEWALLNA